MDCSLQERWTGVDAVEQDGVLLLESEVAQQSHVGQNFGELS